MIVKVLLSDLDTVLFQCNTAALAGTSQWLQLGMPGSVKIYPQLPVKQIIKVQFLHTCDLTSAAVGDGSDGSRKHEHVVYEYLLNPCPLDERM